MSEGEERGYPGPGPGPPTPPGPRPSPSPVFPSTVNVNVTVTLPAVTINCVDSSGVQRILSLLSRVFQQGVKMAGEVQALQAEVAKNTEVTESVITLVTNLAAKIEELKNDPVALQKLADDLKANTGKLSDAVIANTPAE